jgi:LysR family glycine cleavage system transcriptional activator
MSTPLARIPSIDLLRGFVAVGRRMSITLAAQDLFLTQSAVSRQIHGLESALGIKLFESACWWGTSCLARRFDRP